MDRESISDQNRIGHDLVWEFVVVRSFTVAVSSRWSECLPLPHTAILTFNGRCSRYDNSVVDHVHRYYDDDPFYWIWALRSYYRSVNYRSARCVMRPGGFRTLTFSIGSLAAAFQSFMYGGLTPASGIFATLTSMAMLGILMPVASIAASIIATGVTVMVWKYKYGVQWDWGSFGWTGRLFYLARWDSECPISVMMGSCLRSPNLSCSFPFLLSLKFVP